MNHTQNFTRFCLVISLGLGSCIGAISQGIAPMGVLPTDTAELPARGTITPQVVYHNMTWEGRRLSLLNPGVSGGIADGAAFGASFRDASGHGRTRGSRYDSEGWQLWAKLRMLPEEGRQPAVTFFAERVHDAVQVRIDTPTSNFFAAPGATAIGAQLLATRHQGKTAWHGRAGVYQSDIDEEAVATVLLGGLGVDVPIKRVQGHLAVTAYRDDYEGRHFSYDMTGTLTVYRTVRGQVVLGGSLYPRGVPLAGTPFSPASTVGVVYGGSAASQLRTRSVGYLTLAGSYAF